MHAAMVIYGDYAGTLDVSNRTEVRGRYSEGLTPSTGLDVADAPSLRVRVGDRRWDFWLHYAPLLVFSDVGSSFAATQHLESADASVAWHDARARIILAEAVEYGQQNPGYLAAPPASSAPAEGERATSPSVQLLPPPVTIEVGSSRTTLGIELKASRRWRLEGLVEYGLRGGMDSASRAVVPLLRIPRAEAGVGFHATRWDILETRASATRSDATSAPCSAAVASSGTCEPDADAAQIAEVWRHAIARTTELSLGAGGSVVRARLNPADPYSGAAYPVALAALAYAAKAEGDAPATSVRLEAQVAPVVDIRTGIIEDRAQATLIGIVPTGDLTTTGLLLATHSVESFFTRPSSSVQGGVATEYRVSSSFGFGVGVRYVWQEQVALGSFGAAVAFVEATFYAPRTRF